MKNIRRFLWLILVVGGIGCGVLLILLGYFMDFSDLIAYGVLVGFMSMVMFFFVSLFKL